MSKLTSSHRMVTLFFSGTAMQSYGMKNASCKSIKQRKGNDATHLEVGTPQQAVDLLRQ